MHTLPSTFQIGGIITKKKGVGRIASHHKSKLCTCDFCNLYLANQALLQHIGGIVLTKHKSLHPYETLGNKYLLVLFGFILVAIKLLPRTILHIVSV
jgi:hypothetical protein